LYCGYHSDKLNSFLPVFSAVAGCLIIQRINGKEVRVAFNAQSCMCPLMILLPG
jgi:hypothetical protein